MAGFYIHIPFCKKVCYYCDFHFVATLKYKDQMLEAMQKEIVNRSQEWKETRFNTLYFGGGTPSVLSIDEIKRLIDTIFSNYYFIDDIELTLEANPDDLTKAYLKDLKSKTEINRFSIGTQSFHDEDLKLMNRRHTGVEAVNSIRNAQEAGFENLNIDLIYGVPGLTMEGWKSNIETFVELKAPHLSAYHLMFEPKTVFDHMRKKNKIQPVDDTISQRHYSLLTDELKWKGYRHYEISNFAMNGHFSKHNTNYWLGEKYIGIGPSAHSFNGATRRWNVANNTKYCSELESGSNDYFTVEELTETNRFNEYILTSLRTEYGADYTYIADHFGSQILDKLKQGIKRFKPEEHYQLTDKGFRLSESGWLISDFIMRELFIED